MKRDFRDLCLFVCPQINIAGDTRGGPVHPVQTSLLTDLPDVFHRRLLIGSLKIITVYLHFSNSNSERHVCGGRRTMLAACKFLCWLVNVSSGAVLPVAFQPPPEVSHSFTEVFHKTLTGQAVLS